MSNLDAVSGINPGLPARGLAPQTKEQGTQPRPYEGEGGAGAVDRFALQRALLVGGIAGVAGIGGAAPRA